MGKSSAGSKDSPSQAGSQPRVLNIGVALSFYKKMAWFFPFSQFVTGSFFLPHHFQHLPTPPSRKSPA
jgi:hypothetical protein